jgi:hypothetical protein
MIVNLILSVLMGLLVIIKGVLAGVGTLVNMVLFNQAVTWAMGFDAIVPVSDALVFLGAVGTLIVVMWTVKLIMWVIQLIRG